jgi:PadR family transcriptional regulator, regulatory protein AphA
MNLTPTSYIVLGLVSLAGRATPYALKQAVAVSVGFFWSIPHSQLYAEPERLARAGYLKEEREPGGRRRKTYSLTAKGRRAFERWRAAPTDELEELRDPGTLKLFFGADPRELARVQLDARRRRLAEYEAMYEQGRETAPEGPRLALEFGIHQEREAIRFWSEIADEHSGRRGNSGDRSERRG